MTDFADVADLLATQAIELPSWAFGNSGTRFKVFGTPGTPRTVQEKLADAAKVHEFTGLAPKVALHIPWDKVDDYAALRTYAADLGVALGTVNSNTFQDDIYKFGSLTHVDESVRRKAIDHHFECIEVMNQTGSRDLKIWLADGTNYAGQGDIRGRQDRLADSLAPDLRPDRAGSAAGAGVQVLRAGVLPHRRAGLGHLVRPGLPRSASGPRSAWTPVTTRPGTNIEFIVAQLLRLGKLGSFDFNSRYYADDDLIVGSADPFQLFRILYEVIRGGGFGPDSDVAFMLDQCHNVEEKIPGQIRSVLNVQEMTARALLVDRGRPDRSAGGRRCAGRQRHPDGRLLHRRPRRPRRLARVPRPAAPTRCAAYAESGYQTKINADRVGGHQAGWGA